MLTFGALQGTSTNWRPALLALVVVAPVQMVGALVGVSGWTLEDEPGVDRLHGQGGPIDHRN